LREEATARTKDILCQNLKLTPTRPQFSKSSKMDLQSLLLKLKDAFNTHDIKLLIECFDESYSSEQPVHPDRTFNGQEQVKKNWASNFAEMPDFSAHLLVK